MKRKLILPILLSTLLLSLVSCNKKTYDNVETFNKEVVTYKNEVSLKEFVSVNEKLKEHKTKNYNHDYVMDTYCYESKDSKSKDEVALYDKWSNEEIKHYCKKADYDNKLIQEVRVSDKTTKTLKDNDENTTTEHEEESFGYQEIGDATVLVEEHDKVVRNFGLKWKDIEENSQPQNSLYLIEVEDDNKYYIDNNVYTVIDIDEKAQSKQLKQLIIKDDKITLLKLKEYSYDEGNILISTNKKIELEYIVVTFKDQKLKPINVTGFDIKGLID